MSRLKMLEQLLAAGASVNASMPMWREGDTGTRTVMEGTSYPIVMFARRACAYLQYLPHTQLMMMIGGTAAAVERQRFCEHGASVVKALLNHGADVTVADHTGKTAADWCAELVAAQLAERGGATIQSAHAA